MDWPWFCEILHLSSAYAIRWWICLGIRGLTVRRVETNRQMLRQMLGLYLCEFLWHEDVKRRGMDAFDDMPEKIATLCHHSRMQLLPNRD